MTYASDAADRITLRLLDGMRDEIAAAAKTNGRSMNAEIIHRIRSHSSPEGNDMAKGNALTIRITDETRERLDRLSKRGPYRISISSIVERGIELAADELERMGREKSPSPIERAL